MQNVTKDELEQFITKLENLEQEKAEMQEVIKETWQEAKSRGFDIKALKAILKLRKMDKNKLEEEEAMLDFYRQILEI